MFPLITAGPQEIHIGTRILGSQQVQQQVLGKSGTRVPNRKQPLQWAEATYSLLIHIQRTVNYEENRRIIRKTSHFNKTCTSKLVLFHRIMDIK